MTGWLGWLFRGDRRILVPVGAFFLLLFAVLAVSEASQTISLTPGQVASTDIVAPHRAVNVPLYNALKAQAKKGVSPVYVADRMALPLAVNAINATIKSVETVKASLKSTATTNDQVAAWQSQVGLILPAWAISDILAQPVATLADLGKTAAQSMKTTFAQASYRSSQIPAEQSALAEAVAGLALPDRGQTLFLEAVLNQAARPNLIYSETETEKAVLRAQAAVAPPVVEAGQLVIAKGQKVTSQDITLLKELGLGGGGPPWRPILSALVLALIFTVTLASYVRRFRPKLLDDPSRLFTLGLVALLTIVVSRIVLDISPLLVPMAFLSMVAAILLGGRLSFFLTLATGILLEVVLGLTPSETAILFAGAVAGTFGVSRLRDRNDLLRAPLWVGSANLLLVVATEILAAPVSTLSPVWTDLLWAVGGAVLSSIMAIGFLPFFETYLGILSPLKLLELSNPNQPILRRLMMEAPGTYHHSLIVSNMAVAAADAVGGDSLLCRVGAYFHDIGKVERPAFFVDNQMGGENPHDRIAPSLSTLIITSHVKDGLEMADQARLPKEIKAFIAEHHGTTMVSFFYHKAKEQNPDSPPLEQDYRYPGPKPQSRETAILMLADGCEATVRAMKGHTLQKLETTVRKIIRERLYDEQLDESGLTLKDLDAIAKSFVVVLSGVYHTRIEYPEAKDILERRGGTGHGRSTKPSEQS